MCNISERCGRSFCIDPRHHWLEIKKRNGPLFAYTNGGDENQELAGYRSIALRDMADAITQVNIE